MRPALEDNRLFRGVHVRRGDSDRAIADVGPHDLIGDSVHEPRMALRELINARGGLGFEALSAEPFIGAGGKKVLFFHPRTTGGVLLEICQLGEATGHHDSATK